MNAQPLTRQQTFLQRADAGDLNSIITGLVTLVQSKEILDSKWKTIWAKYKDVIVSSQLVSPEAISLIDAQVSQIEPIDKSILRLRLKPGDDVCILLGAGASASAPSNIPTVTQLLPELWRRARKLGRDDINKLADWCNSHGIKNIEDLLTAAYLSNFAAKNNSVTSLLDYFLFAGQRNEIVEDPYRPRRARPTPSVDTSSIALLQETLQMLFGLLTGTMIPAPPNKGHDAILDFVKQHARTSIVTTNYDGCVDEALLRGGLSLNSCLDEDAAKSANGVDLIKIHGSINWAHCDSCHSVKEFDLLNLKDSYDKDTISYPVIGICRSCGGQRRPLLIPPMGFKFVLFPNLIRLWHLAGEAIEKAEIIIVVGFSFSEADSYINKIIARSMTRKDKQKIIVCDPNPALVPGLHEKFSSYSEGFDKSRIMKATESSDKVLPRILASLVKTDAPPPEEESKPTKK